MIIERGINPNCSEATVRIRTNGEDPHKTKDLFDKISFELNQNYEDKNEVEDWDDEKPKREFDWSEAYIEFETIFGTECLKIRGDAPYNCAEEITGVIKRYLPRADVEWSEP